MKAKEVLTTGEVARICHVAPRTVSKWFDSGKLRGYRIPGSRDRRIPLQQLLQFMRAHGMPLEEIDGHVIRVLVADPDQSSIRPIADAMARTGRYEVRLAENSFQAGMVAGQFQPHVILVDVVAGAIDANQILKDLRSNPDLTATKIVAVGGLLTKGQAQALQRSGFDAVLTKPYGLTDLARVVEDATNLVA